MLRGEFKVLTGLSVPESVFEVIHKDYMASKLDKAGILPKV